MRNSNGGIVRNEEGMDYLLTQRREEKLTKFFTKRLFRRGGNAAKMLSCQTTIKTFRMKGGWVTPQ